MIGWPRSSGTQTTGPDTLVSPMTYIGLVPNAIYNFYIMQVPDDGISSDTLLYITQMQADENGSLSVPFEYEAEVLSSEAVLVCAQKTDISAAEITIEDMEYTGEEQAAEPKVVLNGVTLVEDEDYELAGDYVATEIGSYVVRIQGIGNYTGSVEKEYRIKKVLVTAQSAGSATITCTAQDGSGIKATCKVTVTDSSVPVNPTVEVTKITLNKTTASVAKGKTLQLTATVTPASATNKAVTWKSSNTKIATVSSTGKVTAKSAGTVTITCTAKDGSGKKATCKITVYNNTQAYVARIYTKALGRTAEPGGLNYWTDEIRTGKRTPVQVAEEFFFAPEFTNKKLNNTEYVKVLYRTFMGREYDKGGLDYWVARLNKGESRKSVLESFAGCEEFKKIVKGFGL